jgi:putative ABC transport system permease protein
MLGMPMTESGSSTPRQKDGGGEASEEGRAITAVLIKVRNQLAKLQLPRQINEVANLQAAVPAFEIRRLQKLLGFGTATLQTLGLAIMIVAGLSVFIALFNNLKDRRYEMALMRSMGLPPARLFLMVLLEGLFIGLGGYALGLLLSRLEWLVVRSVVQDAFRYQLETPWMTPTEGWLLVATLFISLLAALIPALRVMRMDISKVLAEA